MKKANLMADQTYSCPKCGKVGSVEQDAATGKYRCVHCREQGFDPTAPAAQKKPPVVPASDKDHVIETYVADGVTHIIKTKCSKNSAVPEVEFDPRSPAAKFAKRRLRNIAAQERRYGRTHRASGTIEEEAAMHANKRHRSQAKDETTIESLLADVDNILLKHKGRKAAK